MKMGRNRSNQLPEGWQGCPSMGTGFVDDRFFVFKTPLKTDLNNKVPQSDRFSIETVFQRMQQMNNSRIGLWIDLTNTSRYYNPSQIQNRGVIYQKLSCEGHGKPPSKRTIAEFCGMVHHFFRRNRHGYVGVHCTHGFNRTGYLICCYLIRYRKYTAAEAVQEFSKHRQPGIYRQIYIDDLYTMTLPLEIPIKVSDPEWLLQQRRRHQQVPVPGSVPALPGSSRASSLEVPPFAGPSEGRTDSGGSREARPAALLPTPTIFPIMTNNVPTQSTSKALPPIKLSSGS